MNNMNPPPSSSTNCTKKGGLRTMPFIFANEISEKLAVVGFSANMMSYLTQELHLPVAKSATTLTNFNGTASLTPILGAFLADAYIGRFTTIAAASFIYTIGMTSLTISALLPQFRPPPSKEVSPWQMGVLYVSLLLAALGAGGIRPCVVAFGADQFEEGGGAKAKMLTWSYFNWYYFCMGVSMLLAVTVVVYIQENVGWGLGLGIPTIAMALSAVSFIAGGAMYRKLEPAGSPFTRLVQVVVAAIRKRKEVVADPSRLYQNDEIDAAISLSGKLVHTDQLRFFDKAGVEIEGERPDPWRLSTVHRIEELKSVIRMAPIWSSGILLITAFSQQSTFSLQQARAMDCRIAPGLSSFTIPPGSMPLFAMLSMLATISLYDRLLVPYARRRTGLPRGISFLLRIGIGLAFSSLATALAALVEIKRKHASTTISVFWLVPQHALHGAAEAFTSIGHLEFFYDQAPESMRSTSAALFWAAISAGNYVSTLLVSIIHRCTAGPRGANWLPDDLDKGKLDYLYWIVTFLQVVNLAYYTLCAKFYTYKPLQLRPPEEDDGAGMELPCKESL